MMRIKRLLFPILIAISVSSAMASGLPDLGDPSPNKIWPAVAITVIAVAADQQTNGCGYPCNHYAHVASGAALSAATTYFYGEKTGWAVGIGFAFGAELYGKYKYGKAFRMKDVAGRGLGVGGGIWIMRAF